LQLGPSFLLQLVANFSLRCEERLIWPLRQRVVTEGHRLDSAARETEKRPAGLRQLCARAN
jgi:hypothetical protein